MKSLIVIVFALFLVSTNSFAGVEIKKLDFSKTAHRGTITVEYDGVLRSQPELIVTGKSIQVILPDANVKNAIEKSVSFSTKNKDTDLRAYQTTKNDSKIKANFAFDISKKRDSIALILRDNKIELSFPRVAVKLPTPAKVEKTAEAKPAVKKEFLDEKYLNNLLKIEKKTAPVALKANSIFNKKQEDTIKTKQAATTKAETSKNNLSLVEYIGKFVAFLGVVLLLFYGVVTLMKKGFIKKGKLGFLNNTEQVSVISTTYIAPKKSLMLIKAHNQVFLVSNTDSGIHPISEIKDVAGFFKEGEKTISGQNFDTNYDTARLSDVVGSDVKIKEDITKSNVQSAKSSYEKVKEKVTFSDQIKKKVQNLKPLQ